MLDRRYQMVLKAAPDGGGVVQGPDSVLAELIAVADPGPHQNQR